TGLGQDLEALLLFLDFLPGPLLLFRASLPPPPANRAPLAGLDLAPRIHPEDEQDDDADHAAVDRIGLPGGLTDVHGERCAVLLGPPRVGLRRVVHIHLERLVSLTVQWRREHDFHRVARGNRVVRRCRAVLVEPLGTGRQERRLATAYRGG